ncbi:MAG TPA: hypothetical protein VN969_19460 [Streptosporangiaceae bacterium]|nr:hypothetical protein [Streptosporangiaceae bacterium]
MREAVRERHRQHGHAGVGHPSGDGKQQWPGAAPAGEQAGHGDRDGYRAGDEDGQRGPSGRVAGTVLVRSEQRDGDADRCHDGEDRQPATTGQPPPGEPSAHPDADQERAAEYQLHRGQRTGTQRRGVRSEAATLQRQAGQPQRLPYEQGQEPCSTGLTGRGPRGLPVFDRCPGSVEHGGQHGEQ